MNNSCLIKYILFKAPRLFFPSLVHRGLNPIRLWAQGLLKDLVTVITEEQTLHTVNIVKIDAVPLNMKTAIRIANQENVGLFITVLRLTTATKA